jgi:hypothetical protein
MRDSLCAAGTSIEGCSVSPLTQAHVQPALDLRRLLLVTDPAATDAFVWSSSLAQQESQKAHGIGGTPDRPSGPPELPAVILTSMMPVILATLPAPEDLGEEWDVFIARPDAGTFKSLQVHPALSLRDVTLQPPALTLSADRRVAVFCERGGCWSVGDDVVLFDPVLGVTTVRWWKQWQSMGFMPSLWPT